MDPDVHNHNLQISSFQALFFPLMDRLYGLALRLTRDRWDAEDLVQDTYMKAWRFFHQYKAGTNSTAWIFRILLNNFISLYHSRKRDRFVADFGGG